MMTASRVGSCVCNAGEEEAAIEFLLHGMFERYGPPLLRAANAYIGPNADALLADVAREQEPPPASLDLVRRTWEAARGSFRAPSLVVLFLTYPAMGLKPGEILVDLASDSDSAGLPPSGPVQ